MVENFPVEVIDAAWKEIPRTWIADDELLLEQLLELLLKRRTRVADLLTDIKRQRASAFPNWQ
jgi:hypothetical protein